MTVFFDPREFNSKPKREVDFLPLGEYIGQIDDVFIFQKDGKKKVVVTYCVLSPETVKNKCVMDWILLDDTNLDEKAQTQVYFGKKRFAQLLTAFDMGDRPLNDPKILEKRVVKFLLEEYNGKNRFKTYTALEKEAQELFSKELDDMEFDSVTNIPF